MNPVIFLLLLATCSICASQDAALADNEQLDPDLVLTEALCQQKEYKKLHTCKLLKKDRTALKKITNKYFYMFDFVNTTRLSDKKPKKEKRDINPVDSLYDSLLSLLGSSSRSESMMGAVSADRSHSVVKRYTTTNECKGGVVHSTIYYAEDASTWVVYELVQDPGDNLYQMFYIWPCQSENYGGYDCVAEPIVYKTLVYLYPPEVSDEVGTKYVRIFASCALHQILN